VSGCLVLVIIVILIIVAVNIVQALLITFGTTPFIVICGIIGVLIAILFIASIIRYIYVEKRKNKLFPFVNEDKNACLEYALLCSDYDEKMKWLEKAKKMGHGNAEVEMKKATDAHVERIIRQQEKDKKKYGSTTYDPELDKYVDYFNKHPDARPSDHIKFDD